jgi:hypothetical protein
MATSFQPSVFNPAPFQGPSPYSSRAAVPAQTGAQRVGDIINLQKGYLDLDKSQQTQPAEVARVQAESQSAQTRLNSDQLENMIKHTNNIITNIQPLMTKPDLSVDDIKNLAVETVTNAGGDERAVKQALSTLPAEKTPSNLRSWLAQQQAKAAGALTQLDKLYPGGVLPSQLPQSYQPSAATTEGGYSPAGTQGTAPKGVTAEQMSQGPKSDFSKPVALSYPVRQAGQAYTALPQEEAERKIGTETKSAIIARQADIPQSRRSIDEVIKKAQELEKSATLPTSGVLGSAERNISTFLGTEQGIRYKELSKDLANAQIANITASGGSLATDAGKQLVRMANGDETYPPKVLIEIARRTQADMLGLDSKATAIKKFADKFGDQNISAFNQMWAKNADPKIFQLKNIFDDQNMSADEKAKARDALIGKDEKQKNIFEEKWNNIKKLEQTGSL